MSTVAADDSRPPGGTSYPQTEAFARACRVLAGAEISRDAALTLAKTLRNELAYAQARAIAHRYRQSQDDKTGFELLRIEVTATYKDPEVATEKALRDAWQTMVDAGYNPDNLRIDTPDYRNRAREISGLAGAITKRLWEYDGRVEHLQESLRYYKQGYGGDVSADDGYQAVNAAFVLDLIASLAPRGPHGFDPAVASAVATTRGEADKIRSELVTVLQKVPPGQRSPWASASLGEALFGLRRYQEAADVLRDSREKNKPPDWEIETGLRQLTTLARIQSKARSAEEPSEDSLEWKALVDAYRDLAAGVRSAFVGKIGLALSGGGFRASLYHIGVLARLAELDVLRHVEVLSCVSGGSIIGAYFYLELRHLLQSTQNHTITQKHYIDLVARIEDQFLAGVQTNIRTRLLSETSTAWANTASAAFSQTERLGELFEEVLFARVNDGPPNRRTPRWLSALFIEPCRTADPARDPNRPFTPRAENWKLCAKAPILILNATTLNTGHPWQFTASHMGEPEGGINPRIDANARLERVRFSEAPDGYRQFRLGHAVAASAAVPSLFDPLPLEHLYARPLVVRLADGGVYDNQGIAGLLEQGCTFLIISDASGQTPFVANPAGDRLRVAVGANNTLMGRVRGLHFDVVSAKLATGTLRGAAIVHLMQDIQGGAVNQRGAAGQTTGPSPTLLTRYGVRRDIQEGLARIRTDLDAFSDFEAYALMASGYHAIGRQFDDQPALRRVLGGEETTGTWKFASVVPYITTTDRLDTDYQALCALLRNGQSIMGKLNDLDPGPHRRRAWAARAAGLITLILAGVFWRVTTNVLGVLAGLTVLGAGASLLIRGVRPASSATDVVARKSFVQRLDAAAALSVSWVAGRYVRRDNRRYLAFGSLVDGAFLSNSKRRWPTG